jgi:hypothetical protein
MRVAGERTTDADGPADAQAPGATREMTLGERIVEAARLATAVHLFESLAATSQHYGRQFGIGGAGPVAPATADRVHPRRPFRICDGDASRGTRAEDEAGEAGSR